MSRYACRAWSSNMRVIGANTREDVACVDCETPEYHWTRPTFPQ